MNVSACLVTRGDVDMQAIIDSLPLEWEIVVWDNQIKWGDRTAVWRCAAGERELVSGSHPDLAVYGRYAAIEYASHDLIYVQDDDVIVSDPEAIVRQWRREVNWGSEEARNRQHVVCNMPQEFRPHYPDSGLVGFGAAFHRDAPHIAFGKFWKETGWLSHFMAGLNEVGDEMRAPFLRRADNIFTVLTPRVLVDVPKTDLPYANADNRMWKQPDHEGEKQRMLKLAREVRDSV